MLGKLIEANESKSKEKRMSLEGYTPHPPEVGRTFLVASLSPIVNESGYKFMHTNIVKKVEKVLDGTSAVYLFETDDNSYHFFVKESFLDK